MNAFFSFHVIFYAYLRPSTLLRPVLSTPVIIKFLSVSVSGLFTVCRRFRVANARFSKLSEFSLSTRSSFTRRSCSCNRFHACLKRNIIFFIFLLYWPLYMYSHLLGLFAFLLQGFLGSLDLFNLVDQAILDFVSDEFHSRSIGSILKTGVCQFHRRVFFSNSSF